LLFSYALNNYWHTNYKADQEGPINFSYSIQPHAAFAPAEAARFGRERREPLVVSRANDSRSLADRSRQPAKSLFHISPESVMVSSVKPIADGNAWLVYLYNPTAADQRITLQFDPAIQVTSRKSDAFGKLLNSSSAPITIAANGSLYLRVDRAK
jgi:alpha-mannosidase